MFVLKAKQSVLTMQYIMDKITMLSIGIFAL